MAQSVTLFLVLIGAIGVALSLLATDQNLEATESAARAFLDGLEDEIRDINYNTTLQSWNYETNITDETLDMRNDAVDEQSQFLKGPWDGLLILISSDPVTGGWKYT
ncbi:AGAP009752-PA-like protein [Anopheles sinensis]|uniref:AGAP009752-PA-like protein n=1 Tax=Anopheles sinensis TaxID=74873 RepID=A0A084VR62_ANOSI|nr:AGAP009752-PA-like protein [Anopheles sinensis]